MNVQVLGEPARQSYRRLLVNERAGAWGTPSTPYIVAPP